MIALFFILLVGLLILISSIFWILMIIDCAKYETGTEQIGWILLIVLAHGVGALIYYFCRKLPRGGSRI